VPNAAATPSPIVLVHGAMHGSWCWDCLVPLLTTAGHSVATVDLPGPDSRRSAGDITLADYTACVLAALEPLQAPALLVGHSMGGLPVSTAADARPERVRALVYLCAAVPEDGKSLAETTRDDSVTAEVRSTDNGLSFTFSQDYARRVFFGDCAEYAEPGLRRLRPQPLRPLQEIVHLSPSRFGSIRKHYVVALRDQVIRPELQEAFVARLGATRHALDSGHSPYLSHPDQLAQLLRQLAVSAA
jgi:pimeloyl-ACP methyl ester carboxylesterase